MHFCHQELQMILMAVAAMFPFLNFIVKPCCKHLLSKYHKDHKINDKMEKINKNRQLGVVETGFLCKCGVRSGWISEDYTTPPCPNCGRVYRGVYNKTNHTLEAVEVQQC